MKYLKQMAYIFLVCIVGQFFSILMHGIVPGNVIAMILLFLMLAFKWVRLEYIAETSDFLLTNMAFLFVPVTVSVFFQYDAFAGKLLKLLIVCVITMVLTSLSAGYTVKLVLKLQNRRREINE